MNEQGREVSFTFQFKGKEYTLRVWATSMLHLGFDANLATGLSGAKSEPAVFNGVAYTLRFDAERKRFDQPWALCGSEYNGQVFAGNGGPIYMTRSAWPTSGPREPTTSARNLAREFAFAALDAFVRDKTYADLTRAGEEYSIRMALDQAERKVKKTRAAHQEAMNALQAARARAYDFGLDPYPGEYL